MTTTTSRRAILAGAAMLHVASLPALAAPAVVAAAPDPIFAAIEKHRHWHAEATTRLERQFDFEDPTDVRALKSKPIPGGSHCGTLQMRHKTFRTPPRVICSISSRQLLLAPRHF